MRRRLPSPPSSTQWVLVSWFVLGMVIPTRASAEHELDPSRALEMHVGRTNDPAPLVGVSTRRDHVAQAALPAQPRVLWQRRLPARLATPPAVEATGRIVVGLETGRVVQLDRSGRIEWSVPVGSSAVLAGPVLTQSGDRWVLTRSLEIWRLRADGTELGRFAVPAEAWRSAVSPLPLENGDVVFAVGRTLFRFGPRGQLVAKSRAATEIFELLASARHLYAVLSTGQVFVWTPDARLAPVGAFASPVARGPLLTADERIVAGLGNDQVVELDPQAPRTARLRLLGTEALVAGPTLLDGRPLGLLGSGALWQPDTVDPSATHTQLPSSSAGAATGGGAALLSDREGRILIARAGGGLVALDSGGSQTVLPEASCPAPLALVPAGRGRALLACSSGMLWLIGASEPPPSAAEKGLVLRVATTQVRTEP